MQVLSVLCFFMLLLVAGAATAGNLECRDWTKDAGLRVLVPEDQIFHQGHIRKVEWAGWCLNTFPQSPKYSLGFYKKEFQKFSVAVRDPTCIFWGCWTTIPWSGDHYTLQHAIELQVSEVVQGEKYFDVSHLPTGEYFIALSVVDESLKTTGGKLPNSKQLGIHQNATVESCHDIIGLHKAKNLPVKWGIFPQCHREYFWRSSITKSAITVQGPNAIPSHHFHNPSDLVHRTANLIQEFVWIGAFKEYRANLFNNILQDRYISHFPGVVVVGIVGYPSEGKSFFSEQVAAVKYPDLTSPCFNRIDCQPGMTADQVLSLVAHTLKLCRDAVIVFDNIQNLDPNKKALSGMLNCWDIVTFPSITWNNEVISCSRATFFLLANPLGRPNLEQLFREALDANSQENQSLKAQDVFTEVIGLNGIVGAKRMLALITYPAMQAGEENDPEAIRRLATIVDARYCGYLKRYGLRLYPNIEINCREIISVFFHVMIEHQPQDPWRPFTDRYKKIKASLGSLKDAWDQHQPGTQIHLTFDQKTGQTDWQLQQSCEFNAV